jgi:hypothetical protein
MHASKVLQKILSSVIARLDLRNTRNLLFAVEALLTGRRLTLMELARHFPGAERVDAPLKRFDRLLSNRSVQAVRTSFYKGSAAWLLRSAQPVILVDWSELKSDGKWHLLRAAVSARGRALTLYEEVHPEMRKGSPEVEAQFLRRLQELLPNNTRPILVADAGFRVPWFRVVESLGWHWVGRVRGTTRLCFPGKSRWIPCRRLFPEASARCRSLGWAQLTESNPIGCRLVLARRRCHGRHQHTRHGWRARGGHSEKMAARMKEPWLLAVSASLDTLSPARVVKLYARRMQIEQSFRDLKSHRYGCAFEDTLTRDPRRLEMLLLIHALASLAAWLEGLGAATETELKSTTPPTRRFHSVTWIGFERLRRQSAVISHSPTTAAARLRQILAEAA